MTGVGYFNLKNLILIVGLAAASAFINMLMPIKLIFNALGVPGPAAGMAFLGGFIFVFWISLAHEVVGKRFAGTATAILIAAFCLLASPWYGVVNPPWFGIYGILAFLCMGAVIEASSRLKYSLLRPVVGGGFGNLSCLIITWVVIGLHTNIWIPQDFLPIHVAGAFLSGAVGGLIASTIIDAARKRG